MRQVHLCALLTGTREIRTALLTKLRPSIAVKVALITGAASAMGRATAHLLADEGAHVAATDIDATGVGRVVNEIRTAGLSAEGWSLDLADATAIDRVVAAGVCVLTRADKPGRTRTSISVF